ncbi:MAG: ABC transporter permease [Gemmatimonadota bacterium]|nr:MAG: ABC transporter permease [Gemmatimonadota bacterium]
MFKNYIVIALRNIKRYKGYSCINIIGLATGMVCCLFIALWILDELSYDRFHEDTDRLYQVLVHRLNQNRPATPIPLAPALKKEVPEIVYATRYGWLLEVLLSHGDRAYYESEIRVVDADFFKILTFPLLKGNPNSVLNDINSIVISKTIAQKYFPDEDPIGKVLTMNHRRDFVVTGVMRDIPQNSTLQFDMVVRHEIWNMKAYERKLDPTDWSWHSPSIVVRIPENMSPEDINVKIKDFIRKHDNEQNASISLMPFTKRNIVFRDTHNYITIFSVVAIFLLIIACINFMNFSTARSSNRACEIVIRKVSGAQRNNIFVQFLSEAFVLTITALIVALLLISVLLPFFNNLVGRQFTLDALRNWTILPVLGGLALTTALVSGSYPALFLSSLKPTTVLRNTSKAGAPGSLVRKILVVFQFSTSIFLVIGTGTIYRQLEYMKSKDVGYVKDNLLTISLKGESRQYYEALKMRLLSDESIVSVSGTSDDLPEFDWNIDISDRKGANLDREMSVDFNYVDYNFFETLGIEMIDGGDYTEENISGGDNILVVNEKLVELMGFNIGVGHRLHFEGDEGIIVGVIENVHFRPLTDFMRPIVFLLQPQQVNYLVLRLQGKNIFSSLRFIKKTWEEIMPLYPFEYEFVTERFNRRYTGIERMGHLFNVFTFIAIFIACLGLFGLASFISEQRSKEIGIRKALGASVSGIMLMLSREFLLWVLMANCIAWPIAWLIMNTWLDKFAYRITMSGSTFVMAGTLALMIAFLTVSYQTMKAALANPVKSLRYE